MNLSKEKKEALWTLFYLPEVGEMHLIMFQESVNGTHLERLELYNPSSNAELAHLYNSQPSKPTL